MNWGAPHLLPWLPAVILALAAIAWLWRRRLHTLRSVISPALAETMIPGWVVQRSWRRLALWSAALLLLFLALARPQWGYRWKEIRHRGLDIVVVLDTSRSMLAEDLAPNRLQQAKWAIEDMVPRLRGDRIALVPFAGVAFLQIPLTFDYAAFLMHLRDTQVGTIPRGGTHIEQALRVAIDSFDPDATSDRVILLVTDGESTEGDPLRLLPELEERGIRVYAVGVGTPEGDLIPDIDPRNRQPTGFVRDPAGNVVRAGVDEATLSRLALATGGSYIRARSGDFGFDRMIDQEFARLKRDDLESRLVKRYEDQAGWFLALAFALLAAEAGWREKRRTIET